MFLIPLILTSVSAHLNCLADAILGDNLSKFKRADFSYESRNPEIWGTLSSNYTLCKEGKYQSPINFEYGRMLGYKKFTPSWLDYEKGAVIDNANGFGTKVTLSKSSSSSILPFDSKDSYKLLQFHFHVPSEHHRDEEGFPLEVHFVHATADTKLAVVGFWFYLAEKSTPFLNSLFENGFPTADTPKSEVNVVDLRALKENIAASQFWSYDGSLTVPPCSEGVKWGVSNTPLPISVKHYEGLRQSIKFTARPTQQNASPVRSAQGADILQRSQNDRVSVNAVADAGKLDLKYGSSSSGALRLYSSMSMLLVFSLII